MVKQSLKGFPRSCSTSTRKEHDHLSGYFAVRTVTNALKLRHSLQKHCGENPFTESSPLKNLASSALVPENAQEDMVQTAVKGQKRFKEFL
jgi:hypothetical protein